ncbi:Transposase InsF for insertion sequence IS3, Mobile element protein [Pectobacterium sp. F1-1]|nr:Transposase InsF for insertion sequence IS3, Mobile element protein [Pectobacterium sp. F1-1]
MKYVFIEKHQAEFSIKAMCRELRVARSGWYVWRSRRHQVNSRQRFRLVCDAAVSKAFNHARQWYGAPRLADELPDYNVKTIAASLRRQGLRAKAARKFSPVSYNPSPSCSVYSFSAGLAALISVLLSGVVIRAIVVIRFCSYMGRYN